MNKTKHHSGQSVIPTHRVAPSREAILAQRQQQDQVIDSLRRKLLGLQAKTPSARVRTPR